MICVVGVYFGDLGQKSLLEGIHCLLTDRYVTYVRFSLLFAPVDVSGVEKTARVYAV